MVEFDNKEQEKAPLDEGEDEPSETPSHRSADDRNHHRHQSKKTNDGDDAVGKDDSYNDKKKEHHKRAQSKPMEEAQKDGGNKNDLISDNEKNKASNSNMEDISSADLAFPPEPLQTGSAPGAFRQAPTGLRPDSSSSFVNAERDLATAFDENDDENDHAIDEEAPEYATTPQGEPLLTATLVVEEEEQRRVPTAAITRLEDDDDGKGLDPDNTPPIVVDAKPFSSVKGRYNIQRFWRIVAIVVCLVVATVVAVTVALLVSGGDDPTPAPTNAPTRAPLEQENENDSADDSNEEEETTNGSSPTTSPVATSDPFQDDIQNYQHISFHFVEWGYFADDCQSLGASPTLQASCQEGAYIEHFSSDNSNNDCVHTSAHQLTCEAHDDRNQQRVFFEFSSLVQVICASNVDPHQQAMELTVQVNPVQGVECGRQTSQTPNEFHSEITSGVTSGYVCSNSGSFDSDMELHKPSPLSCDQGSIVNLSSNGGEPVEVCSTLEECINVDPCDVTTVGRIVEESVLDTMCWLSKPNGSTDKEFQWNNTAMWDLVEQELTVDQFQRQVHLELSSFDTLP